MGKDNKYKICAIPINLLDVVWSQLEPIIDHVVEYSNGEALTSVVKDSLYRGETLAVTVCECDKIIAVAILEQRTFETGKRVIEIPLFGGKNMSEWRDDMIKVLNAIAKDFNCVEIIGRGCRSGWVRALKDYGWKEKSVTISYEVK